MLLQSTGLMEWRACLYEDEYLNKVLVMMSVSVTVSPATSLELQPFTRTHLQLINVEDRPCFCKSTDSDNTNLLSGSLVQLRRLCSHSFDLFVPAAAPSYTDDHSNCEIEWTVTASCGMSPPVSGKQKLGNKTGEEK